MKRIRRALIPCIYKCLQKDLRNQVSPVRSTSSRATWRIEELVDFGPDAVDIELDSPAPASPASSTTSHVTRWLRDSDTRPDAPTPELPTTSVAMDSVPPTKDNAETHLDASVSPGITYSTRGLTDRGDSKDCKSNNQQLVPPRCTLDFCGGPENCGEPYAILETILQEMRELHQEYKRLDVEIKNLNSTLQHETVFRRHCRCNHMERFLSDLDEQDENDDEGPMKGKKDTEKKLEGIREELLPDTSDISEISRTRVSKVDHQQHQEHITLNEQLFTRTLKAAMIKYSLTISVMICLLFYRAAKLVLPFLRGDMHVLMTTTLFVAFLFLVM